MEKPLPDVVSTALCETSSCIVGFGMILSEVLQQREYGCDWVEAWDATETNTERMDCAVFLASLSRVSFGAVRNCHG